MEDWKETILRDAPRLSPESEFRFACHPGLLCFGKCCADVNIFLTPYDVLRMKNALGMSSQKFLEEHTIPLILEDQQLPVVVLKMGEDEEKKCPFVSSEGCTIYEDRPWSCRMYPLGLASAKAESGDEDFCFIVGEDSLCQGFKEDKEWTVKEWMKDQGVDTYNKKSESYMQFTLHKHFQEKKGLEPEKVQMLFKVCYNADGFREMLFESSFFARFEVEDEMIEKLRTDDEALLEFGFKWLRFVLFHEDTIVVKDEEVERVARSMHFTVEEME